MSCDCDCYPDFYSKIWVRKTKVLHRCGECRNPIPIGSVAIKTSGKWHGDLLSWYTCTSCEYLMDLVIKRFDLDCWCFEWLNDGLFELDLIWDNDADQTPHGDPIPPDLYNVEKTGHVKWLEFKENRWQVTKTYVLP